MIPISLRRGYKVIYAALDQTLLAASNNSENPVAAINASLLRVSLPVGFCRVDLRRQDMDMCINPHIYLCVPIAFTFIGLSMDGVGCSAYTRARGVEIWIYGGQRYAMRGRASCHIVLEGNPRPPG